MKLLIILTLIGLMTSCNAQNSNEILEIVYEAYTRGSSLEIKASPKRLFYKSYDSEISRSLSNNEWKSLAMECSKIELDKIHLLHTPSENRTRDMAMHANLKVLTGKGDFKSVTFDHGNPPKELKVLVDQLFKLAKIED